MLTRTYGTAQELRKTAARESEQRALSTTQETPCFFIVGAPCCGTTAMSRYLRQHPNICFSTPKETHFFLSPSSGRPVQEIGAEFFESYFPPRKTEQWMLGEGSASYFYAPDAIHRILEVFPRAKFVAMVRNPVDMIPAYHGRVVFLRQETETNFARAWAMQANRERGQLVPRSCRDPRVLQYAEIGQLGKHLLRLFEAAGRERCHVVVFDDLIERPLETYRSILDFIGVPYDGRTEFPNEKGQRVYRSAALQSLCTGTFLMPAASSLNGRFINPEKLRRWIRPLRRRLGKLNSTRVEREVLKPEVKSMLAEAFRDDIALLGRTLGRDFSHWAGPD